MLGLSTSAYGHNFTFLTTFHSIKKTEFGLINQKPPELPISHFQIGVNEQILNKISFLTIRTQHNDLLTITNIVLLLAHVYHQLIMVCIA